MNVPTNILQVEGNLNFSDEIVFRNAFAFTHSDLNRIVVFDQGSDWHFEKIAAGPAFPKSAFFAAALLSFQINLHVGISIECLQSYSKMVMEMEKFNIQNSARYLTTQLDSTTVHVEEKAQAESADSAELKTIFNGLAKNWREATGGFSLTMRRYAHTSYQQILTLEPKKEVISLILRELQSRPDRWFEALKALTKANPATNAQTFDETVRLWIEWGKAEKYIS